MDINFKDKEELKKRVMPALEYRINELNNITIDELWQYLIDTKWKNSINLQLYEVVDDILNEQINL